MSDSSLIHLFLVDVDDSRRAAMKQMLPAAAMNGVVVVEADSAQALLRVSAGVSRALVILDLDLPDKDGYQTVNQMQAQESASHMAFLLVGPHLADRRMRLHRALHETLDYLPRPLLQESFGRRVESLLNQIRHSLAIESIHASDDTLADTMREGLLGMNAAGMIVYANQKALTHLRTSAGRLFGVHVLALLEEPVQTVVPEWQSHPLQIAVARDTIIQIQKTRLWRADGSSVQVSSAVLPLRDDYGLQLLLAFRTIETDDESRERLARLTHLDSLTGLPLRTRFEEALAGAIEISAPAGQIFAVYVLDVDHFNYINESLGYEMGDRLIQAIAERLKNAEAKGLLARMEGDRFALLAERVHDERRAALVGHQLRSLFRQPFLIEGHELFCSVSIGIALYPACGNSASSLLGSADAALTRAKQLGRNNVQFYTTTMNRQTIERLEIESALHRAIGRRELQMATIPVYMAEEAAVAFEESVLTWNYQGQTYDASALRVLAEETGLQVEMGEWLLEKTCRQLERQRGAGAGACPRVVRISLPHLINPYFKLKLKGLIALYGVSPEELVFSVNESLLLIEEPVAKERLDMLAALGFRLLLEGFGTGQGSLVLLRQRPWHLLRLDAGFSQQWDLPHEAGFFTHLLQLVKSLGIQVVAEGVETEEQLAFLVGQGCDYVQGVWLNRPRSCP